MNNADRKICTEGRQAISRINKLRGKAKSEENKREIARIESEYSEQITAAKKLSGSYDRVEKLAGSGKSNAEIARIVNLSPSTVANIKHIAAVRREINRQQEHQE